MSGIITANSDNKNEVYELLVGMHKMATHLASLHGSGWYISRTYTNCDQGEYLTAVSNGTVEITADTVGVRHAYTKANVNNA